MLAQIVKSSGYALEYNSCVLCGSKTNIVNISYTHGGFICKKCASSKMIYFEYSGAPYNCR